MRQSGRMASGARVRRVWAWLALLGLICLAELLTHAGARNPFLESSRPLYNGNVLLPGDGYISWAGTVPVLHDADGIFTLVSMFVGERGPENTGILDRRAAYAYLASLTVTWLGPYAGFLAVNLIFWWGASAAAYWFVRRRWGDEALAMIGSALVATGNGFLFMAGVPMSYLPAYACMLLILALAEWLGAFRPDARLRDWLLLGWAGGVAATLYFAHLPILLFWCIYGARRAPWRCLLAAAATVLAISLGWEMTGRTLVGLGFSTDNSSAVGGSVSEWLRHLQTPLPELLIYFRGGPLAGAAAIRGTLLGAFPYPWWVLAAIGFLVAGREQREWAVAVFMAGLLPAIVILSLLPLPRAAFYMYPAIYILAASGALTLGRTASGAIDRLLGHSSTLVPTSTPGVLAATLAGRSRAGTLTGATVTALCVLSLVLASNADLLGYPLLSARFHIGAGASW